MQKENTFPTGVNILLIYKTQHEPQSIGVRGEVILNIYSTRFQKITSAIVLSQFLIYLKNNVEKCNARRIAQSKRLQVAQ
jgi:hypothetical protein